MADVKCQYELKGKYNGVYGYTNDKLTDTKAEVLAKKHPLGSDLFSVVPAKLQKVRDEARTASAKSLEDYRSKIRAEVKAEQNKQAEKLIADSPKRITVIDMQRNAEKKAAKKNTTKTKD